MKLKQTKLSQSVFVRSMITRMLQVNLNDNLLNEWLILEQCTLLLDPGASSATLAELLSEQALHWGEIIQQALRHNMLPLLAYVIQRNDLTKKVPHKFRDLLSVSLSLNRHELTLGYSEIARIVEAFEQQSIGFAVTKGYTFDSTLYNSAPRPAFYFLSTYHLKYASAA